jgi:hypothetical protein
MKSGALAASDAHASIASATLELMRAVMVQS